MKKCFVIDPIGKPQKTNKLFKEIIMPAIKEKKYYAIGRTNNNGEDELISKQVLKDIIESEFIIADLSYQTPNIFYELAVCHVFGKPIIKLLEENSSDVDFDTQTIKTITYSFEDINKLNNAIEELKQTIDEVISKNMRIKTSITIDESLDEVIDELIKDDYKIVYRKKEGYLNQYEWIRTEPGRDING